MRHYSKLLAVIGLFACIALPRQSIAVQELADDEPQITAAMRKDDARLDLPVTIASRRITIGELLEDLTKRTGVTLKAGERDGAADPSVAVFCKNLPLHRVLNSLWSVMSYREATWVWDRAGAPGSFRYELTVPRKAQKLRERLLNWTQQQFERNAEKLMAVADGTDEDRQRALKEIYGDPDFKNPILPVNRLWADIRAFKHALTSDQQKSVLRGEGTIEAPLSALDEKSRERLLSDWRELTRDTIYLDGNGVKYTPPDPASVRFELVRYISTPSLCVNMVANSTAAPYEIGGVPLESAYRAYLSSLWLLPTDQKKDFALERMMTKPEAQPTETTQEQLDVNMNAQTQARNKTPLGLLSQHLEEIASGASVALFARLPEDNPYTSLAEPWGLRLGDYWQRERIRPVMTKWRDGVHLITTQVWPIEDPPIPLFFVRQLRKDAIPGKLLPFEDLVQAAGLLTVGRLGRLTTEFPVMQSVAQAREILALFYRVPALANQAQTKHGLTITDEVANALRPLLPPPIWQRIESGEARTLSLRIIQQSDPRIPPRDVVFQLRDRNGKFLTGYGFKDQPQPELPSKKQ